MTHPECPEAKGIYVFYTLEGMLHLLPGKETGGKQMKENFVMRTFSVLLAILLVSMGVVSVVSAEKTSPRMMSDWEKEHTILTEHTTDYYLEKDVLHVQETYSSPELKSRFDTDQLVKTRTYQIESETAEKIGFVEGQHYTTTELSEEIFTSADDPPVVMRAYDYPQWIYEKIGDTYHQLDEPINIAWESNNLNTVKSEMLNEGWWDAIVEYVYYIYDNGWIEDDGVASDPIRLFGGWHIRLWQMSDGDVVGAAHHDSAVPHHADGFENAEEYIAAFYDQPDDDLWHVYEDYYALNNYLASPYNNGMCTQIYYW
jgi:hypothetical protein